MLEYGPLLYCDEEKKYDKKKNVLETGASVASAAAMILLDTARKK